MQLKQVSSKYDGQVNEDMRGTLREDEDLERAYNEKDVIALQIMIKAINFSYKKSKEPIKNDVAGNQGSHSCETIQKGHSKIL